MPDAPGPEALEALSRAALAEITPERTVGQLREATEADGVATLLFSTTMGGYPGWVWTVSVSTIDPEAPSVLETELMPGDGALVAPDWVPWADRMDEFLAQQAEQAAAEADAADDDDDADDDDADEHDLHDDHDADVFDGVDIDAHADEFDASDGDGHDSDDDSDGVSDEDD